MRQPYGAGGRISKKAPDCMNKPPDVTTSNRSLLHRCLAVPIAPPLRDKSAQAHHARSSRLSTELRETRTSRLAPPTTPESLPPSARISFELSIGDRIQTLSTTNARKDTHIGGLLYVPELHPEDPCVQTTAPLIPNNVTRRADLPDFATSFITVAPWVSTACTLSFLAAESRNPPDAAIFYIPDASADTPPPSDHQPWDLGDDDEWKTTNKFPVYAIPGVYGAILMRALNQYSGNLTDVPYGQDLVKTFQDGELIRMYSNIGLEDSGRDFPRLWIFLLAVLALLIGIVVSSSVAMRMIQRRRRLSLERRVAAGEVDLETLGIKRLNVPQSLLGKMPLYTYDEAGHPEAPISPSRETASSPTPEPIKSPVNKKKSFVPTFSNSKWVPQAFITEKDTPSPKPQTQSSDTTNQGRPQFTFSQLTCPICLDDYVSGETTVRELPCQHIFHPECIDNFLLQSSSLCPVCKKSTLPRGYCPEKITDLMVRQERFAQRLRREREAENAESGYNMTTRGSSNRVGERGSGFRRSIADMFRHSRQPSSQGSDGTEPSSRRRENSRSSAQYQEEMRMRAMAMLGDRPMVEEQERALEASRPKWLKILRKFFPTL
ncbi:hypothetical protein FQN50_007657 [Emmonsiellopsis sp. PD_5]|nr:hypothetical protein FQN50_007657 [Emmonsiellopsis sp. PD_5]